eukprot:CAMPEP_0119554644 /NCGR_PEP_ID=MMETSP1352-20130426/7068_1 /TAXON_ID=265584 /ORGANISM="Stauroneis constricta, Strain CCMP1120" /LENGTH=359 /DNA_ID=CAMNT_0007601259 /DNA_START=66 /DNA_END=1143 /DNA_ORIENTATION=+
MAQNALLGNRISLISKKNIRYEGTLYSINQANATVALQNVRAYGTEGREKEDPSTGYVAPQDSIHPYLLFRGCDIKDLHVHENASAPAPPDPAILSSDAPPDANPTPAPPPPQQQVQAQAQPAAPAETVKSESAPAQKETPAPEPAKETPAPAQTAEKPKSEQRKPATASSPPAASSSSSSGAGRGGGGSGNRRNKKPHNHIGTGASLLNRKARGTVNGAGGPVDAPKNDFDFESNLKQFKKSDEEESDEDAGDANGGTYEKDDFFDSISCDAMDRQNGVDNRLRGARERNLNTETFGAVALILNDDAGTTGADEAVAGVVVVDAEEDAAVVEDVVPAVVADQTTGPENRPPVARGLGR